MPIAFEFRLIIQAYHLATRRDGLYTYMRCMTGVDGGATVE